MTLDKIETLLLTLALIVPGFIMFSVVSFFAPRKTESKELLLLRFLTFGTLNLMVSLPIFYLIATQSDIGTVAKHNINVILRSDVHKYVWLTGYFLTATFLSPTVLGLIIALADQHQWLQKVASRLKLHAMHGIPTAWDFKFHGICQSGGRWVVVTLKDERLVTGFFGSRSFASTDPVERDLYIQTLVDSATFETIERTDGIYIKHDDIRSIEFIFDQTRTEPTEQATDFLREENANNGRQEPASCIGRAQPSGDKALGTQGAPAACITEARSTDTTDSGISDSKSAID